MTGLITFAFTVLCGTATGLDYRPVDWTTAREKTLERTIELASKKLNRSGHTIVETVFSSRYAGAYSILRVGDRTVTTFLAIDPDSGQFVRVRKGNLICKK